MPTPDDDKLRTALEQYEIGQTVPVTVVRDDETVIVNVELQAVD